jgi:hypothetical protein
VRGVSFRDIGRCRFSGSSLSSLTRRFLSSHAQDYIGFYNTHNNTVTGNVAGGPTAAANSNWGGLSVTDADGNVLQDNKAVR